MSLHLTNALGGGLRVVVVLKVHFYRFVFVLCDYVFDVNFRTYVAMCMDYCNSAYRHIACPRFGRSSQKLTRGRVCRAYTLNISPLHMPSLYARHTSAPEELPGNAMW
jgi:hypothetical protein